MLPKIVKAVVKGIFWFVFLYVLPTFILSFITSSLPEGMPNIFSDYEQLLGVFTIVVVFFIVASELTSGTIFQHMFNVGRALVLMGFIVVALEGGVMSIDFQSIRIAADLTIDLLMLAKSVLQAINFLGEKAESQLPTPSPRD
jgi:DMSO/TMAO reductase YedYZ heme-binding membrane subunit